MITHKWSILFIFLCFNATSLIAQEGDFINGQLFVKLKDSYTQNISYNFKNKTRIQEERLTRIISKYKIKIIESPFILDDPKLKKTYLITFDDTIRTEELIRKIQQLKYVEYVEKVPLYEHFLTPNDLHSNQWNLSKIQAELAWNITTGNTNVVIAMVDDAVLLAHEDLAPVIWTNPGEIAGNLLDDDANGYIDDVNGWDAADNDNNTNPPSTATNSYFTHGTHTSGIAGAATNNGKGIASISYNVRIMPVKIADDNSSSLTGAYQGVQYAIAAEADVISMSWGGYYFSQTYQNIFNYANSKGIICVAAAGNSNTDIPMYPASYDNVISVGATISSDLKSSFSNYGPTIDVMAPGSGIWSCLAGSNSSYGYLSGTSMACPLVSGLAALMLSKDTTLTPIELESCLKSSCYNIDALNPSYIGQLGAGRINAYKALLCLKPINADFTVDYRQVCPGGSVQFTDLSDKNPTSWQWSFTGGTPSSSILKNPVVNYSIAGTYSVTLIAANTNGSDTITKTAYITVAAPSAAISGATTIYNGSSANLRIDLSGNPQWTIVYSNGTTNSTVSNITNSPYYLTVSPAVNTTYTLVSVNDNGCSGNVSGSAMITVIAAGSNDTICFTLKPGPLTGKDASISTIDSNLNYGTSNDITAFAWTCGGPNCTERSFVKFELSQIPPNSIITNARLSLFQNYSTSNMQHSTLSGSNEAWIQRIIEPWDEMTVTWNTQPATSTLNQVYIPASTSPTQDYPNIVVKELVQDMLNNPASSHGFMIKLQTEIKYRALVFASSDHADSLIWPELKVCYIPPDTTNCFTLKPGPLTGKDQVVNSNQPTQNLGNKIDFDALVWSCGGLNCNERGFIEFDLSSVPAGASIQDARLSLYYNPTPTDPGHSTLSGSNACWLERITTAWDESTITWNTMPSVTTVNSVNIPASTNDTLDYPNINVTALVQDIIDSPTVSYGMAIRLQTETKYRSLIFSSSDHTDSTLWPELKVCYTSPDTSATDTSKCINYDWAKDIGSTGDDYGRILTVDAIGNVYITGKFEGTADFDAGVGSANLTAVGSYDIFFAKYDANGIYQWAKSIGSTTGDEGNSIAVDTIGNVYITGYFSGTADFDPGIGMANLTAVGTWNIFFAKYDANGNYQWANRIGGTGSDYGKSIAVDNSENVYITGQFEFTADFDPGVGTANLTATGIWDIFFAKYDANGNYLWAKSIGGTSVDEGNSVAVDTNGNVYITGDFVGTADFDPSAGFANLTAVGMGDIFFAKYNANGNYLWAISIGGIGIDNGFGIAVDGSGNVYITGGFTDTADFDPGAGTANLTGVGSVDIFFAKYDASGNYLWAKSIGSTSDDRGFSLALDSRSNIYLAGWFTATADFDPGTGTDSLTAKGGADIFFAKYNTNGNYQWAKSIGSTFFDNASSIAVNTSGNVYITGLFSDTVDFDPGIGTTNLTSIGTQDIFFAKYAPCNLLPSCDIIADFSATLVCTGDSTSFTDLSKDSAATVIIWKWYFGDGDSLIGLKNPKHKYSAAGTYSATLIAGTNDTAACFDTITKAVTVVNSFFAFAIPDDTICTGDTILLGLDDTLCGKTPFTYSWSPSAGLSDTSSPTPKASPSVTTTYIVTVTDSLGTIAKDSVTIVVNTACCKSFAAIGGTDSLYCYGDSILLTNKSSAKTNATYQWEFGADASPPSFSAQNPPLISYGSSGAKRVQLILNDSCGTDTVSVNINVFAPPVANAGPDSLVCFNDTIIIGDTAVSTYSYLWSPALNLSDTIAANPRAWIDSTITYYLKVTDNQTECKNYDTVKLTRFNIPPFSLGNDTIFCKNDSVVLLAEYQSSSYLWQNNSTGSQYTVNSSGIYWVKVTNKCGVLSDTIVVTIAPELNIYLGRDTTLCDDIIVLNAGTGGKKYLWSTGDTNNAIIVTVSENYYITVTSVYGCKSSDSIVVGKCIRTIIPPNIITPNGDGSNDTWIIRFINDYPGNKINIYNRNGNLVYEASDYKNDWGGKWNGNELPAATYYYVLDLNNGEVYKGTVTIIREK